jgi:transcriptional regulator with XRE-family HTH domain
MDFGEQIKIYRKINNLSQQDIADLLGVTKQTISGWEKGKFSPPLSFVYEIAEKLNVSVNWLLGAEQKGTIESPKDPNLAIVYDAWDSMTDADKQFIASIAKRIKQEEVD